MSQGYNMQVRSRLSAFLSVLVFLISAAMPNGAYGQTTPGPCLAWNIAGSWQYRASAGGYGTFTFIQSATGTLTGTFTNVANGASGPINGSITGSSLQFQTIASTEVLRGVVSATGIKINGSFTSGTLSGTWEATGSARCLQFLTPPASGLGYIEVRWGDYVYRWSYGTSPAVALEPGQTPANPAPTVATSGPQTINITFTAFGANLPPTIAALIAVNNGPPSPTTALTRIGTGAGGSATYTGNVVIPGPTGGIGVQTTYTVFVVNPANGALVQVFADSQAVIDPSGYLYNSATNARIDGATVTLLRNEAGQWVSWNADAYDQTNPQVSNADGTYGWFVPDGDYQVRASKRCFLDVSSASLHIPPPRTDVNLPMTPATCSGIRVTDTWIADTNGFSQYEVKTGDTIDRAIVLTNTTGIEAMTVISWTVTDPTGARVAALSGSGTFIIPPFGGVYQLTGTIPDAAPEGNYRLSVHLTDHGQTSSKVTTFFVRKRPINHVHAPLGFKSFAAAWAWTDHWETIKAENFEGAFPTDWHLWDLVPGAGDYSWGKRNCRAASGTNSGWGVGGGANGAALGCGSNYPPSTHSWLEYGPFSLADATAAELNFSVWYNTETGYDKVGWAVSTNGTNYYGYSASGSSNGWLKKTLDLANVPGLGNVVGQSSVWIAFVFSSDADVQRPEGAYVDDIELRKYVSATGSKPAATVIDSDGADTPAQFDLPGTASAIGP